MYLYMYIYSAGAFPVSVICPPIVLLLSSRLAQAPDPKRLQVSSRAAWKRDAYGTEQELHSFTAQCALRASNVHTKLPEVTEEQLIFHCPLVPLHHVLSHSLLYLLSIILLPKSTLSDKVSCTYSGGSRRANNSKNN